MIALLLAVALIWAIPIIAAAVVAFLSYVSPSVRAFTREQLFGPERHRRET